MLQAVDAPVELIVSRPFGARLVTIVDTTTGITVPKRPDYLETISMVHHERVSNPCPLTIIVNLRAAFDLRPGTYRVKANFTPIVPAGSSNHLDVFPAVYSNEVVVTVMP
jgi:hypothetical protein